MVFGLGIFVGGLLGYSKDLVKMNESNWRWSEKDGEAFKLSVLLQIWS